MVLDLLVWDRITVTNHSTLLPMSELPWSSRPILKAWSLQNILLILLTRKLWWMFWCMVFHLQLQARCKPSSEPVLLLSASYSANNKPLLDQVFHVHQNGKNTICFMLPKAYSPFLYYPDSFLNPGSFQPYYFTCTFIAHHELSTIIHVILLFISDEMQWWLNIHDLQIKVY